MSRDDDGSGDVFDRFLRSRGHEVESEWRRDGNKRQCPECGAIHPLSAEECNVCDWKP